MPTQTFTLAYALDLEIGGVWTDIRRYFTEEEGNIRWRRGLNASLENEVSSARLTLSNASGDWTPGNRTSPLFNAIRKGARIRFQLSDASRSFFLGFLYNWDYDMSGDPDAYTVELTCFGIEMALKESEEYALSASVSPDIDDVLTNIANACGISNTDYSFEDSVFIVPYQYQSQNAFADCIDVVKSEPGARFFTDQTGKLRFKKSSSLSGNYSSVSHTWNPATSMPTAKINIDWRRDAVYSRQSVKLIQPTAAPARSILYRHPWRAGIFPPKISANGYLSINGEFTLTPLNVDAKFNQGTTAANGYFSYQNIWLAADITSGATTLDTASSDLVNNTVERGATILLDSEKLKVTAVTSISFGQRLTVTRGVDNTVAVSHSINSRPDPSIPHNPVYIWFDPNFSVTDTLYLAMTNASTTLVLQSGAGYGVGTLFLIEGEQMRVSSTFQYTSFPPRLAHVVTRGENGTTAISHSVGVNVSIGTSIGGSDPTTPSTVEGSYDPTGLPVTNGLLVGAVADTAGNHIWYSGRKFNALIHSNSNADVYLSDLIITGYILSVGEQYSSELVLSQPIPGVAGFSNGKSYTIPYGVSDSRTAMAALVSELFAHRIPAPWISYSIPVDRDSIVTDILSTDITDLVRYTATSTDLEKIDDWFRVGSISGQMYGTRIPIITLLLYPAHFHRNPRWCWYYESAWRCTAIDAASSTWANMGTLYNISGSAVKIQWNDSVVTSLPGWTGRSITAITSGSGSIPASTNYNPDSLLVNLGVSDHVLNTKMRGLTWSAGLWSTGDTRGAGLAFRCNNTWSERWEVRINPTAGKIFLWNTVDGKLGEATWTSEFESELEVRCQGDRIRVYYNAKPEPVIDITSTRFQGNSWGGLDVKLRTGVAAPEWIYWYGQGL